MKSKLVEIISSSDPLIRNQPLELVVQNYSLPQLLQEASALEEFRQNRDNLYEKVRALFFLYSLHRFHFPAAPGFKSRGLISFEAYSHLLQRRFEEAIEILLAEEKSQGPNDSISSALASAYYRLGIQTLADQVRRSVRTIKGNQWMFRLGHPADQPLRIRPELLEKSIDGSYPILRELTPVRMDLTHSAWSDIFFLGMDFPEGAKVLNVSIDLGVKGRDMEPQPPVEAYFRVIDEPVLRLSSVDLGASIDIDQLSEVFDFAKDYLGLLKAAVIASGIVPPGMEGSGQSLAQLLAQLVGPGRGLEIVSSVNNIPKGSRLAVSTNLLAALIAVCMRATGQARSLEGCLQENERRLTAARAILGEWIGGSGGGWQDSGGVWPGMKLIEGATAGPGDSEFGVSRGQLLPSHRVLGRDIVSDKTRDKLQRSLVLVHGGMAQNVGPILEMVTEKYLLRSHLEWNGRQGALKILDEVLDGLRKGDIPAVAAATTRNFFGPLQTIIPWASNFYTETLIERVRKEFGKDFLGFWMLGGMSGGGMGFIFEPHRKDEGQAGLQQIMARTKSELEHALPFAMDPVVYDFAINENGTFAKILRLDEALMPVGYYTLILPSLLRRDPRSLSSLRRIELDKFASATKKKPELSGVIQTLFDRLLPKLKNDGESELTLSKLLEQNGFDRAQHEQIRADMRNARIGLAQNRLPAATLIRDVEPGDVFNWPENPSSDLKAIGEESMTRGEIAVLSLAAGIGSRWTQGAGVVKALHPFCKMAGKHRTFIEVHLAKSQKTGELYNNFPPHVVSTSYLTHGAIEKFLKREGNYGYSGQLKLSPGKSIGLRMIPMVRDLRFNWEEMPQQLLDAQAQKVRNSLRSALIEWTRNTGEGNDYTDNLPSQCLHPVGHWYEVPNLLKNGVLRDLIRERPQLRHLLLHNIDTLGADINPELLGHHISRKNGLTFEMISRRIDDRGGGLARVNGRVRLVEGLAMPREEEEFALSYYNSMTTWIEIDLLLESFGLGRGDLENEEKVSEGVRMLAAKMPTYVTIKDVKKRWGHGQEDVFPVAQFEKLWSDMTGLPDLKSDFVVVPRLRGQQLKDQAQLDGWLRDGSAAFVESLCHWR